MRNRFFDLSLPVTLLLLGIGVFFSGALVQISAGLLFCYTFLIILPHYRRHSPQQFEWMEILAVLLLISGGLAWMRSASPAASHQNLMRYVEILTLIPLIYYFCRSVIDIRRLSLAISAAALLVALAGLFNAWQGMARTEGFYGGYFTLASLLVFTLPVTAALALESRGRERLLAVISMIAQLPALWLTGTRSAIIILGLILSGLLVVGLTVRLQKTFGNSYLVKISVPLVITTVLLGAITLSENPRINPLLTINDPEAFSEYFSSGRFELWQDAYSLTAKAIAENQWNDIFLGHGLGSRKLLFDSHLNSWESDYLEVFMNQGLAGLLILLAMFGLFAKALIHSIRSRQSGTVLVKGFALGGFAFIGMSFFTMQLLAYNSCIHFGIIYAILLQRQPSAIIPEGSSNKLSQDKEVINI